MPAFPIILRRSLSVLTLALLPVAAMAAGPSEAHLDFAVLRNGDPVGHHRIDLTPTSDGETVSVKTNVVVRAVYVPVYRFEHTGSEVWKNGRLVSLQSQTNDDGDKHTLAAIAKDGHIEVVGDGVRSQADSGIIPASLWNSDLVKQMTLLNTLTGKKMAVSVADLGEDTIQSRGTAIKAHHYQVTGELQRELWYDPSGTLAQVKFKAKDDSDILYVLG
jgi:hypothetical protein